VKRTIFEWWEFAKNPGVQNAFFALLQIFCSCDKSAEFKGGIFRVLSFGITVVLYTVIVVKIILPFFFFSLSKFSMFKILLHEVRTNILIMKQSSDENFLAFIYFLVKSTPLIGLTCICRDIALAQ
jgi:hypothetical protein